jgi:carbamoyl-phosphate synthase large subunit
MNVLLTSIGRRAYLVRYFQEALAGRGRVLAANSLADAPGMQAADLAFEVPPSHDPGYGDAIAAICREHQVGMLCACHDLDALALASEHERLGREGVVAVLPSPEWARICLDKFECGARLRAAGFAVPWGALSLAEVAAAVARGETRFPFVIKARYGFGSLGLALCHDMEELECCYRRAAADLRDSIVNRFVDAAPLASVLVQEYVGGPELRVVLVNDLSGRPMAHFITEVLEMRAGETDRATTLDPGVLGDLPERVAMMTRHVGVWGIDIRMDGAQPAIIDLNPRFTGDYPFQHLAGANVPAALIAWAQGGNPDPTWLRSEAGVTSHKDIVPVRSRLPA